MGGKFTDDDLNELARFFKVMLPPIEKWMAVWFVLVFALFAVIGAGILWLVQKVFLP